MNTVTKTATATTSAPEPPPSGPLTLEILPGPQPPVAAPSPALRSRNISRRNGRIARLPKNVRDMISHMLADGVPHKRILVALEELEITGISLRNISNWATRGGYQEWVEEQKLALDQRITQEALLDHLNEDEPTRIPEVGIQALATGLSHLLVRTNFIQESQQDPRKLRPVVSMLSQLARDLLRLQNYRDSHLTRRIKRQEAKADTEGVRLTLTPNHPPCNPKSLLPPRKSTEEIWPPNEKTKKLVPHRPRPLIPARPVNSAAPPAPSAPATVPSLPGPAS